MASHSSLQSSDAIPAKVPNTAECLQSTIPAPTESRERSSKETIGDGGSGSNVPPPDDDPMGENLICGICQVHCSLYCPCDWLTMLCSPCRRCSTTVSGWPPTLFTVCHCSQWAQRLLGLCVCARMCSHLLCSLQPCMHCYCAGCYSGWMARSSNCPQV